ncbi:MAG: organic solvent tolerance protein [Pseudobdellovibrio sp.]
MRLLISSVSCVFVFLAVVCLSPKTLSKEMPQRLGFGIKDNTSESIPSLALVYNLNGMTAVTGGLGVDTKKDYSKFQINGGIRHIIFHENQLHFYAGGQLGLVTLENPTDKKNTGFEANVIIGTEFFFTGLENVGFSFEGGIGLSTVAQTRIRTIADHPLKGGIIFYF